MNAHPSRMLGNIDAIFNPKTVALIGATEKPGSVGRTILWNLISNPFGATIYAVNPKRNNVLGIKAYPTVSAVPEQVDLAILVTPATSIPGLVQECVDAGVKGAIIISAGFREIGEVGIALEEEVLAAAKKGNMRIIGPNCLGVMNPITGMNATFASTIARPGSVGFISQSGALCTSILDWSHQTNVGFSAFISIGAMLDADWGDLIYYLGDDPHTKSIVIYMESIGNARSFLSAAREVALSKPIIVIKAGQTEAAAQAAASHTGSLAGSDGVLSAAFRRSGVSRVYSIESLFYMAEVLEKQPRPRGPRLTILTNAGGPGVLATDAVISDGGELAELAPETLAKLNAVLPGAWSHNNPIDILGDAEPERYAKALEIAAQDPNSDGLLVVLTPQAMTDPVKTAEELAKVKMPPRKPLLASWMGGADIEAGDAVLNDHDIPTFDYPDAAARVFNLMWRYNYNIKGLYETPMLSPDEDEQGPDRKIVAELIRNARQAGYTTLPEHESKKILAAYGIPVVPTQITKSVEEAVAIAEDMGYPVVLKLYSNTITHKTDVGGVQLNLKSATTVRGAFDSIRQGVTDKAGAEHFDGVIVQPMIKNEGYEIIIGSSIDSQFGPVLLFGSGGELVEVFKDSALGLPPLNTTLARRMMEQTKIYTALKGVRGRKPVDLDALEHLLVRFSQLVVEQPWIKEIDINPLLASPDGLIALDGRVLLHGLDVEEADLPRLAIRPYPLEYSGDWTTKKDEAVHIRPIRPEDEPLMVGFHQTLSTDTVYSRYLGLISLDQ
ncbi:MAG: acetate--CoA ligase family protein, partial [Candidatus Hydrogenedentes bacterium]|nr:acetate--CoA ligase family protein [Candidatus Hydrogenedentota bacterium]